jgi:hypothetical protein
VQYHFHSQGSWAAANPRPTTNPSTRVRSRCWLRAASRTRRASCSAR